MNFEFSDIRDQFETYLQRYVELKYAQPPLGPALTYVLNGQGKRIRPLFCLLTAKAHGGTVESALAPALALEMVHSYSLVHDDLPCMDDDDLRRGRPTVHKEFGEDWAVLTGDGLLTDAFLVLSAECTADVSTEQRLAMIAELARAAGTEGMVAGQAHDIYWTGRSDPTKAALDGIHKLKTGALIGASCALGAISSGKNGPEVDTMRRFGEIVGWVFQIRDDLIDGLKSIGKTSGKDERSGKLTYMTTMSKDEAQNVANRLTAEAIDLLDAIGENGRPLKKLALQLLERTL